MEAAKSYAARNRQGSDWFSHGDKDASHPDTSPSHQPAAEPAKNDAQPASPPTKSDDSRAQLIKPVCNSNQWYKYDQAAGEGNGEVAVAAKEPEHAEPAKDAAQAAGKSSHQSAGTWYQDSQVDQSAPVESKASKTVTKEGEAYCRRDKVGSSSNWFSHDHTTESGPVASPRVTSTEGSTNANRMRQSSENWFNYDGGASSEPLHVSKGRTNRPQSSDMHNIFHHDAGK